MAGTNSPRKRIKIDVRYPTNFDPNDRISHLPDDILRHILSLITLHEVGRTSILSKRWQNVRSSNPNLDFDERFFIKNLSDNLTDITRKQKPDLMSKVDKFNKFVNRSVLEFCKHNITMRRFSLFMCLINFSYISHLDHWIWLAIKNNVTELDLHFITRPSCLGYRLYPYILAAESLTVLKLNGCWLDSNKCLHIDAIKIHSLRELCLQNVRIPEHIIQKLILGSPLIESLTLVCCWNVKNIELSSLVNLKKLELQDCGENGGRFERIEFQELKLQSLSYSSDNIVFDINSKFLKTLKVLSIKGRFLTDQLFRRIICICVRLKSLVLSCSKLKRFEISSLRLKKLSLCDVSEKLDNGVLNTPKLRSFGYDGNNLVSLLFSVDMSSVEDAAVKMSTELNASQFFKLRSYLGKFSQKTTLFLHIFSHNVTFLPEELGDNSSIPSISNIKHLKIELYYPLKEKDNYGALLNGLLWSCHPETLSMELGWGYNDEVAKVLCERLGKIDPRDECCSTARTDYWRYCQTSVQFLGDNKLKYIGSNSLLKSLSSNLRKGQKAVFKFLW